MLRRTVPILAHIQTHCIPTKDWHRAGQSGQGWPRDSCVTITATPLRRMLQAQPGSQASRPKMARVCLSCRAAPKPGRWRWLASHCTVLSLWENTVFSQQFHSMLHHGRDDPECRHLNTCGRGGQHLRH